MIIAIHSSIFPMILYPWLRIAVPLFFMISSYFLFSKVNKSKKSEKWVIVKNYSLRLLKYYLFWFIILLPAIVIIRKYWFCESFFYGLFTFIKNLLFCSTFPASWYIAASIIGTFIVTKLSEKLNSKFLFVLFTIVYLICCFRSSYFSIFKDISFIKYYFWYEKIFTSPVLSFPSSLIWIYFGKLIADNNKIIKNLSKKNNFILIIIFAICLYLEWRFVFHLNGTYNNDCYLFLIPLCYFIFLSLFRINIKLKNPKKFRIFSLIVFPLHASVIVILRKILNDFIFNEIILSLSLFVISLVVCYITYKIILYFEDKKYFKFLKYSH